jgi:hypothetical protein
MLLFCLETEIHMCNMYAYMYVHKGVHTHEASHTYMYIPVAHMTYGTTHMTHEQ